MDHGSAPFGHLSRQQKVFTMLGSLLGMLLAALDQTVVATAGPAIQRDLQIDPSLYVWITTSYLVASTLLLPIYGKLSDLFGRRTILLVGIGIFLLGSLLCGISQNTVQLIAFRAVQGMGSAALFTTAFAVVADIFTPTERGKYQGIFGGVFGIASVLGPLVGGFITDLWGWHWVFFINLPIGAVAVTFILAKMPALRRPPTGARPPMDLAGASLLAVFVVPLLLALSLGKTRIDPRPTGYQWDSLQILGLLAVAGIGLVGFLWAERRAADPILDLGLFRNRSFALNNLATFILGGTFLGAIVFLPLFMVNVVGLSATASGLTTTPLTMGIVFGNVFVGELVSRLGRYKAVLIGSELILLISLAVMGFTLRPDSTQTEVTLMMILVGLGLGPSIPLFTLAIQSTVAPLQIGVATSTATFSRQLGSTVGLALMGTVFATALSSGMTQGLEPVMQKVPPALRSQLGALLTPGAAPDGESGAGIDPQQLRQQVVEGFDQRVAALTSQLRDVPREDPRWRAVERIESARAPALLLMDEAAAAMKVAFTHGVRRIYQVSLLIALLGLALTLLAPEIPLREGTPRPPVAE
ncbi:MAG: MFS transporter [Myxococcota bacterium]|nr:MFS transporter [Myxococcota bacterium]